MPSEKPADPLPGYRLEPGHLDDFPHSGRADAVSRAHREHVVVRAAPGVHGLRVEQHTDLAQRGAVPVVTRPLTVTVPRVGWSRPRINRIVVDFPAPLGPSKPVTFPGCTVNVTSSTAVFLP
jgi:hypothetical protein